MVKIYAIDKPEQLKALSRYVKTGNVEPYIKVWSADRNAHNGQSVMNGQFKVNYIQSITNPHVADAFIIRVSRDGMVKVVAELKHDISLRYCDTNLIAVETAFT